MSRVKIAGDSAWRLGHRPDPEEPDRDRSPELTAWLREHHGALASRWLADVENRVGGTTAERRALLAEFFDLFLTLLPSTLEPYRSQFAPLWRQLSELYGSVGAMRGLAAGEIIEEFQYLREAMIRYLFASPPRVRGTPLLLREILRLNRVIDRGVTFASVGHTDALFFALFQGTGAPKSLSPELTQQVREQLDIIRSESGRLSHHLEHSKRNGETD